MYELRQLIVNADDYGMTKKEGTTREHMIEILQNLQPGTSEIMCHPGYSDQELEAMGNYSRIREQELAVLKEWTKRYIQADIHSDRTIYR